VALDTICWKANIHMVGISCSIEVRLVATHTGRIGISIVACVMALHTVLDVVTQGQREKVMVNVCRCPARVGSVTNNAIRWIAIRTVVGVGCSIEVRLVTAHAGRVSIGIVARSVALRTVLDIMAKR